MNDPFIARMIQARRLTWQIRDRYAMSAQEWNNLCQGPFGPIVAVATKALDESIVHAHAA
jgi:hypothetical protein